jgi:hypothetical protein
LNERFGTPAGIPIRPADAGDVAACIDIRTRSIVEYQARLGIAYRAGDPSIAEALLEHLRATDPSLVVVAERGAGEGREVVGYAAASVRGDTWFLGALFVSSASSGVGLGLAMLRAVMPETGTAFPNEPLALMTCTDSLQPISNAMYARYGVVPRVPVFRLTGDPLGEQPTDQGWRLVPIPDPGSSDWDAILMLLDSVDRDVLGYEHHSDHAFVRRHATEGIVITTPDQALVGYGYRHPNGELGPIAVIDETDLPAVVGAVAGRAASASASLWAAGASDRLLPALLRSGYRVVGFPALACWDRPAVDLTRYVPWSLTLL